MRPTRVITPRKLVVTKSGFLTTAPDGHQTIDYEIAITNLGDQSITNAVLTDTPDALTGIVAGSVTTTLGTVSPATTPAPRISRSHSAPLPDAPRPSSRSASESRTSPRASSQSATRRRSPSAELTPVVSDDPDAPGVADPTITPVGPTAGGGGGGGGGDLARPSIGAPTPTDGTVVTEATTISVPITPPEGQSVATWKISATRRNDPETVLASGTGGAIDEAVTAQATFDPTALPNGTYLITVRSTASGGGVGVSMTSLIVDGSLKFGRYEVTYQDLAVAVAGVPMEVRRTYDSLDRSTVISESAGGSSSPISGSRSTVRSVSVGGRARRSVVG